MGNSEGLERKKNIYVFKDGKFKKNTDVIDILSIAWGASVLFFFFFCGYMVIVPWERYMEVYIGVYVIAVVVVESIFYAFIIWLLKRAGERDESANKVILKAIGIAIAAIAIGIFTPVCQYASDLDNWIVNDTEELIDVVKDLQVDKIPRGAGVKRGDDYRVIVVTEKNGSFKFVNETEKEWEVLKELEVGDEVTIHYLPKSKIPTGVERSRK